MNDLVAEAMPGSRRRMIRRLTVFLSTGGIAALLAAGCTGGSENSQIGSSDGENVGADSVGATDADGTPGAESGENEFRPFINVASQLGPLRMIENRYPGVAIFDFDRDGDQDFYVTSAETNAPLLVARGGANRLFRNGGHGEFEEVASEFGVAAKAQNSSAVVACDFNNDGYQDLYVGAMGRIGDELDYRSVREAEGLVSVIRDRLFLNLEGEGFRDITSSAFERPNIRSAGSVACGDVNNDGWLDIYVGNRADQDFVQFDNPRHHGHFNVMYRNNGDLTFTDVTVESGLLSPPIVMRNPGGEPITYPDPAGAQVEGFDASLVDRNDNIVGDPAGQTLATMFFDHDDDGDVDLWVADDGDRLKVYRNDSTASELRFVSIGRAMGVDYSGAWMGFALGDYDRDADLDIFVTNIGYHPLTRGRPTSPGGDCAYAHQFDWGTCFHFLLRNDGTREVDGIGTVGDFPDVADSIHVIPSELLPPDSLEASELNPAWQAPTGLAAYDFGFGTAFFDMENDGDQDLYWLGSMIAKGEGPGGMFAPGFGRMMQNVKPGVFKDVTVEARLVDAVGVDYSIQDPTNPSFNRRGQRLGPEFHENGKGLAKGDLNGDGYVDLIGTNSNGEALDAAGNRTVASGPLFVWLNGGGDNNWITLQLKGRMAVDGTGSNADAIGARVYVTIEGDDGDDTQVQEVLGSSTFLSMNSLELTFGLGDIREVDEIRIEWPGGVEQTLTDVEANRILEVVEPES